MNKELRIYGAGPCVVNVKPWRLSSWFLVVIWVRKVSVYTNRQYLCVLQVDLVNAAENSTLHSSSCHVLRPTRHLMLWRPPLTHRSVLLVPPNAILHQPALIQWWFVKAVVGNSICPRDKQRQWSLCRPMHAWIQCRQEKFGGVKRWDTVTE